MLVLLGACTPTPSSCDWQSDQLFTKYDFPVGVVADPGKLQAIPAYEAIVSSQFNRLTAENIMKPDALQPAEGVFFFSEADELVAYGERNGQQLHGHTLLWHKQLPFWMEQFQGTREEWDAMMKRHIQTIVAHFRGRVTGWDVINEAFLDDGTLRNNIWQQHIGPSYLEKAFRYAHEADPDAKLFYNDFSLAINPTKRAAVLQFLKRLVGNGFPVDGIGLQMHIFTRFPENEEISRAINEVWQAGFEVHLSELDVSMNPLSREMAFAPDRELVRQEEKYVYIFNAFGRIPSQFQYGITIWGVGDGDSWIRTSFNRQDYPLLFDDNYQAKPAYCNLIDP